MPSPLYDLLDLLLQRAKADAELAAALRAAAEGVLAGLGAASPVPVATTEEAPLPPEPRQTPEDEPAPEAAVVSPREEEALHPDDLERLLAWAQGGGGRAELAPAALADRGLSRDAATDAVLAPLATRFRLKAAAARWRAEGADPQRLPDLRARFGEVEGLDDAVLDDAVLDGAVLDGAVLDGAPAATTDAWGRLADAYAVAGTAADVLSAFADAGRVLRAGSPFAEAVVAAAEAQSMVRTAFWALRGRPAHAVPPDPARDDPEQVDLFRWLREATSIDRVYVERHMRWQDPADPTQAEALQRRLRAIAASAGVSLRDPRPTTTGRLLKAAAYHADRLAEDPDNWDARHQGDRLLHYVGEAVEAGVPPTDRRLRDLLAPVADLLPDADDPALAPRVGRALAALYDHLYREPEAGAPEPRPQAPPPHVAEAARLLAGKRLALFGGVPRPEAEAALVEAFGLAGLEWVETRPHQSTAPFEPVVARTDVAVQLIRWSSHAFGDLRAMCDAHGTLFVRAPRGHSPSALARDVLDQISDDLRRRAASDRTTP